MRYEGASHPDCYRKDRPDTCAVVGSTGCQSPAGTSYYVRLAECFKCGDAVCTDYYCSRRVLYHRYGRKRLCVTCIEELAR